MAWSHRVIGRVARLVWRMTNPRTLGVRAILLDEHERVALLSHTYMDGWYLPGGGVDKGESAKSALLRELNEELAIDAAIIERVLGVYHSTVEGKDDHIVIYVARVGSPASRQMRPADPTEIEQAEWFPLNELPVATSPGTLRRIAEYMSGSTGGGEW